MADAHGGLGAQPAVTRSGEAGIRRDRPMFGGVRNRTSLGLARLAYPKQHRQGAVAISHGVFWGHVNILSAPHFDGHKVQTLLPKGIQCAVYSVF